MSEVTRDCCLHLDVALFCLGKVSLGRSHVGSEGT